jgi:hypothetical protein
MSYRYTLERYRGARTRHTCPSCGHLREFVRYIDTQTGTYLADHVGQCNREINCGYYYRPKQYFADHKITPKKSDIQRQRKRVCTALPAPTPKSFIPFELFHNSLANYSENNFVRYLQSLFGADITSDLARWFYIGTSSYWKGSAVFWQIDTRGRIRSGKVMLYNATTGKRVKEIGPDGSKRSKITWAHSILLKHGVVHDYNLRQCLFGEHQLANQPINKPVAIVEAEKTAIIATVYLRDFVWLACGSLNNLAVDKCRVLTGRKVILFPDLNCFEKWSAKAKHLQSHLDCRINVSDLLERKANEGDKEQGFDLADYLVRYQRGPNQLPNEIYIPSSTPNTVEAITNCIEAQRRRNVHNSEA